MRNLYTGNGDRQDIPDMSAPSGATGRFRLLSGRTGACFKRHHVITGGVQEVREREPAGHSSLSRLPFPKQLVCGYVKIFGKDCHFIVRDEAAALFDPQDGQVAALHAQELEPACKGGLGKPLGGAELLHFRSYDVFGCTVPVDFHIQPSLLKMKYMKEMKESLEDFSSAQEKRAYIQGYADCIQVLFHMGLLKENEELKWAGKMGRE